jgi:hypothetical protein
MDVEAEDVGIAVDDQAAQAVAVGVDGAEGVGIVGQAEDIEAEVEGAVNEPEEELFVSRIGSMVEGAQGDTGLGIEKAGAERFAGPGVDRDEGAGFGVGGYGLDHGRVDAGVEGEVLELDPGGAPGGGVVESRA